MDETLVRLISQIQKLAPSVWKIAETQVGVEVQAKVMWRVPALLGLDFLLAICLFLLWYMVFVLPTGENRRRMDGEDYMFPIFGLLVFGGLLVFFAYYAFDALWVQKRMMEANPPYYAIELLVQAIQQGGGE